MAWARRTSATVAKNLTGGGLTSFNFGNIGASTSVGDRIIIAVDASLVASQPHVTGISSTGGGGIKWARDFILQVNHNSYFEELTVWSGVCTAAGSVTAVTATTASALTSGSSGISAAGGAYSGLATGLGLGLDQNGFQDIIIGGAASTTPSTSYDSGLTKIGTNKVNQLIIGVGADAGNTTTLSAGTGFSIFAKSDANGNGQCALQDQDSGSTPGLQLESIVTASGSGFYMAAVLVYRTFAGNTQLRPIRPAAFAPGIAR